MTKLNPELEEFESSTISRHENIMMEISDDNVINKNNLLRQQISDKLDSFEKLKEKMEDVNDSLISLNILVSQTEDENTELRIENQILKSGLEEMIEMWKKDDMNPHEFAKKMREVWEKVK